MDLKKIYEQFQRGKVCEVYVKFLADNDNSKNQIYLSEEFVQILPAAKSKLKVQYSKKRKAQEYIFHNHIPFVWIMKDRLVPAPNAKLIFYPQYPEVRLSGFLKGSKGAPSDLIGVRTATKRVLFLGSNSDGVSYALVTKLTSALKKEILEDCMIWREPKKDSDPIFFYKELYEEDPILLISKAIKKIHELGWVPSCRLKKGEMISYNARNGGGYTLEAHLGISPNSSNEPDYMGWEVKQHANKRSVITLMTPDPDKGLASEGTKLFVLKYGYKDRSGKSNRMNFGGVYRNFAEPHHLTGLKLTLNGFANGEITDPKGSICLVNKRNEKVAEWSFEKIMVHWTKKHNKAVFVPSEQRVDSGKVFYRYLNNISIGQNSKFKTFLDLVEKGLIYLDPALKVEEAKDKEEIKTRYQFRIKKKHLPSLYTVFQELKL